MDDEDFSEDPALGGLEELSGRAKNRSLRSGLRAHTYGASFLSRPKSCSQLLAEFVILLPIYPNHKVFVSSIRNSFVPFNHEAPPH